MSIQYDFALEMAQAVAPHKVKAIHRQLAVHFQETGQWQEAEEAYVKAGAPREAIEMHIGRGDWLSAERLAEEHGDPEALNQILISQAQAAFRSGDFAQFEALLLRAQQPNLVLQGNATLFD